MPAYLLRLFSEGLTFFALHLQSGSSFPPPLSSQDERKCLAEFKNGSQQAKNMLIEHNLRLVAHIIKKYYPAYSEQDDLISIGTIGLIKAVNSFDPDKNIRLATYASRCIENEILMFFRRQKKSGLDVSMNEPIDTDSEGNPLTLMDVISMDDTVADDIDLKIKAEKLRIFIGDIEDARERKILVLRYGLNGGEPMTQRDIAKMMNISRSYVSRIEKKAINDLRLRFGIKL